MSKLAAAMAGNQSMREQTPYERLRGQIERLRPEIAALVGKDNVDRFIRVALNAVQANAKTLSADRKSLILACMKAAQDRLMPDGREAVFNVYNTKVKEDGIERWIETVQYLPMVGGLIKKLYESGHVTLVDAVAVYEKDGFKYQRGDDPKIEHTPYAGDDDPGKLVAAYCIVKLKNGETKREVMFRRDVMKVKDKSKAQKGLLWTDFEDQGWIKSVIKRIYKQLPSSEQLDRTIAHDNEVDGIADIGVTAAASSMDLQALVDGRIEQEMNKVPTGKVAEPVQSAEPVQRAEPSQAPQQRERPAGTQEQLAIFLSQMDVAQDADVLAIVADDTNYYAWDKDSLAKINAKYHERSEALG